MSAEHNGHRRDWFAQTPIHSNWSQISALSGCTLWKETSTHAEFVSADSNDGAIPKRHETNHASLLIRVLVLPGALPDGYLDRLVWVIAHLVLPIHLLARRCESDGLRLGREGRPGAWRGDEGMFEEEALGFVDWMRD